MRKVLITLVTLSLLATVFLFTGCKEKVDEVAVGKVSNAYDILNATINAG